MIDTDLKLFTVNGIVAGCAGIADNAVLLREFLESLNQDEVEDLGTRAGVADFANRYKDFVESRGSKIVHKDGEVLAHLIIITEFGGWIIEAGYIQTIDDYAAVGCGATAAIPVMHVDGNVHKALDAACTFNIHCAYPLVVYKHENGDISKSVIHNPTGRFKSNNRLV